MTNIKTHPTNTSAFYIQSAISFGIALLGLVAGVWYLPVEGWSRAFLSIGIFYCVTSSFTLAKCVRDAQESQTMLSRVDEARLERLLNDYDPFKASV